MNMNRFVAAVVGVWILRVALNWTFYSKIVGKRYAEIASAHPGVFRTIIPGYIGTDLLFALVFVFLFALVGKALGGGIGAGVKLGVAIAILSPVLDRLYEYFGATYLTFGLVVLDWIYQVIAHVIQGALAGVIYKPKTQSAVS